MAKKKRSRKKAARASKNPRKLRPSSGYKHTASKGPRVVKIELYVETNATKAEIERRRGWVVSLAAQRGSSTGYKLGGKELAVDQVDVLRSRVIEDPAEVVPKVSRR